ncbi:hypothetical protein B0H11DRAFT_1955218 [Mycena galericulata]|nr:hypothetical protein B0H11DRAFT_1955218 [Mycena galericulata]
MMHQLIRRQDRETFVIKDPSTAMPYTESVITAKTVQTFVRHNTLVNDPDLHLPYNPFGYRRFAEDMNNCDEHATKWASWIPATDDEPAWTEWRPEGELPTLVDYLVRDADLEEVIPPGHVVVPKARWDAANEAMWNREQGRTRAIASARAQKAAKREPSADVFSVDKRARIASKSAAVLAEYQERKAAEHAAKTAELAAKTADMAVDLDREEPGQALEREESEWTRLSEIFVGRRSGGRM